MKTKLQKDLERIDLLKACIKSLKEEIAKYNKELDNKQLDKQEIDDIQHAIQSCDDEIEEYEEELEFLQK